MLASALQRKIEYLGLDKRGVKTPLQKAMAASQAQNTRSSDKPTYIRLMQSKIAGTTHVQDKTVFSEMNLGDILFLERDENNLYDEHAVAILNSEGTRVGFVPKKDNETISNLLDAGKMLICEICSIEDRGKFFDIDIDIILKED